MNSQLSKKKITEKIGKNLLIDETNILAGKLTYDYGIPEFDEYLNGRTLKEISAIIQLITHPKGLAIIIAKNFSSLPYALEYVKIREIKVIEDKLIFETTDDSDIEFSVKSSEMYYIEKFLKDNRLAYNTNESNSIENQTEQIHTDIKKENIQIDSNPIPAYITIVSAIIIVLGCFMPWLQIGALFKNNGIDNADGALMLVIAILSGALAIFNLNNKQNKNTWVFILAGAIGILIFYFDMLEANDRAKEAADSVNKLAKIFESSNHTSKTEFIGSGLFIVLLGSLGLIFSALPIFNPQPKD